jgi:hypothetical protein
MNDRQARGRGGKVVGVGSEEKERKAMLLFPAWSCSLRAALTSPDPLASPRLPLTMQGWVVLPTLRLGNPPTAGQRGGGQEAAAAPAPDVLQWRDDPDFRAGPGLISMPRQCQLHLVFAIYPLLACWTGVAQSFRSPVSNHLAIPPFGGSAAVG